MTKQADQWRAVTELISSNEMSCFVALSSPVALLRRCPVFAHRPRRPGPHRRAGVRRPPPTWGAVCSFIVLAAGVKPFFRGAARFGGSIPGRAGHPRRQIELPPRLALAAPPPYLPRFPSVPPSAPRPAAYRRNAGRRRRPARAAAERCRSGRTGRSRKPLCALRTVGSNPTLSATILSRFCQSAFKVDPKGGQYSTPNDTPVVLCHAEGPDTALDGGTPAEACRSETPAGMTDKPLRALPTPPQAPQQQQEDRIMGGLAA